jgi:GNAT superfamily N-acetyltransferase
MLLEEVTENTLNTFAELKVSLIKYHVQYARELGFEDEASKKYDCTDAVKHFRREGYSQYLIKQNRSVIGILEIKKSKSSMDPSQECLMVENIYFLEGYRGKGYLTEIVTMLKKKNRTIELECYYELPAHNVYQKLGFKRFKTRYFI